MKKNVLFVIILILLTFYFITIHLRVEKTITFFPIDYNRTFNYISTSLTAIDDITIDWKSESESDANPYLRQDVSLLFANGKLKGIQSKWEQHVKKIKQHERTTIKPDTYLQAISFHHGEFHEGKTITSIQQMSTDELYILTNRTFKVPQTKKEKNAARNLTKKYENELHHFWDGLINYYEINENNYDLIPFTNIFILEEYLSQSLSNKETDKIIGQLWEGLYKNYILYALETKSNDYMPLLLFAKDKSHLLVLFEIENEKHLLKQQINR